MALKGSYLGEWTADKKDGEEDDEEIEGEGKMFLYSIEVFELPKEVEEPVPAVMSNDNCSIDSFPFTWAIEIPSSVVKLVLKQLLLLLLLLPQFKLLLLLVSIALASNSATAVDFIEDIEASNVAAVGIGNDDCEARIGNTSSSTNGCLSAVKNWQMLIAASLIRQKTMHPQ